MALALCGLVRAPKMNLDLAAAEVSREVPVGIEEVAHHDVERLEVAHEIGLEDRPGREERSELGILDGASSIHETCHLGHRDEGPVAENLDLGLGIGRAEELDRGQREEEIPEGAAADDEDSAH